MLKSTSLFSEKHFDACVSCGSQRLEMLRLNVGSESPSGELVPVNRKLKLLRKSHGISLRGDLFHMCRDCGFVFRMDVPYELNDFLLRYVKD